MKRSGRFFLGLLALVLFCLPCFAEDGNVTLTASEFQTLRTALQMADKQLTESENLINSLQIQLKSATEISDNLRIQCDSLRTRLATQDEQLETLTMQLDSALKSLNKLKKETTLNNVILVVVGIIGVAVGGSVSFLIFGGK